MTLSRPKRVKTVVGAPTLLQAGSDARPGWGAPRAADLVRKAVLPELRKRQLLDTEYVEGGFRANLGLPPIEQAEQVAPRTAQFA